MLDLASTIAPAALMRATRNASRFETNPWSDSDPSALCRPMVSKLSLTIAGTQWSGPMGPPPANCRSSSSASASACGFARTMALMAGPRLSYAAIRARYCWTRPWQVRRRARSAAWTCAIVASSTRNVPAGPWRAAAGGVATIAGKPPSATRTTTKARARRTLLLQLGVDLGDVVLHAAHVVVLEPVRYLEGRDRLVGGLAGLDRFPGGVQKRLVEVGVFGYRTPREHVAVPGDHLVHALDLFGRVLHGVRIRHAAAAVVDVDERSALAREQIADVRHP